MYSYVEKCKPMGLLYEQTDEIIVEYEGDVIRRLPCERIPLPYPTLTARAEACMGITSDGTIWTALGFNTGSGGALDQVNPEMLFSSSDGGRTWSSTEMAPSGRHRMCAFTVLQDDSFLLATSGAEQILFHRSEDRGDTWQTVATIPATPFDHIGEGFLSLTQLNDGTVIFPVVRTKMDGQEPASGPWLEAFRHDVFRSTDRGGTWDNPAPTFEGCCETQILQLQNGNLLAAFRYQRGVRPDDAPETLDRWRAKREAPPGTSIFKHVFAADSMDGAETWHDLRPICAADGTALLEFGECHGQHVQIPDGRVVLLHDYRYPYENCEIIARVSGDNGKTWEKAAYHVSFGIGYPASVALEDGTIVTVTGNTPLYSPQGLAIGRNPWSAQVIRWQLQ